jgi:transcription initiation factor IIE alpha subunit
MRVTREAVLDFVLSRGFAPFTTTDIAETLNVKEYAVRGAVSWLKLDDYIEFHAWHDEREHVKVYIWTGKSLPVENIRRNWEERQLQRSERSSERASAAVQDLLNLMSRNRRSSE